MSNLVNLFTIFQSYYKTQLSDTRSIVRHKKESTYYKSRSMSSKGRQVHVKAAAGKAPWAVLFCPRCPNTMSSGYEQDFKYHWSLKLKCLSCQTSWWVCRLCASQRTHLTENSQLSRHNRKFHKGDVAAVPSAEPHQEPTVNTPAPQETLSLTSFGRKASQDYFRASSTGNGHRYLIATALGQESTMSNLDGDDIDMMMTLAHFVTTLTRNQRDLVAEVLSKSIEATRRQYEMEMQTKLTGKAPSRQSIPVPTTKQQLRSIICKGKRCLILNLPHPEVRTLNDHAYILPSECVADLLAHGTIDFNHGRTIHQVQSLAESRVAKQIIEKNDQFQCKSIFLSFWSDDFEPNYSKGNRGSVWICTLTVQTADSGTPRINNVYPLAVGPKGSCHQNVVRLLLDDMKKMERLEGNVSSIVMYDGKKNRMCRYRLTSSVLPKINRKGGDSMDFFLGERHFMLDGDGHSMFQTCVRKCLRALPVLVNSRKQRGESLPNCASVTSVSTFGVPLQK